MVDVQGQAVVAVLTRAPSAGGKTRLFDALGSPPDSDLLAALLLDTLEAAAIDGIRRVVCYMPRDTEAEMRALVPSGVGLLAQRDGDLGARMRHVFDDLFAAGATAVLLIGSDLPALDRRAIVDAQRHLCDRPAAVVLGPSADGGYYLIGATRTPAPLFENIAWSTPDVIGATERRARAAGLTTVRVSAAGDIDTLADLQNLIRGAAPAPRTRAAIAKLGGIKNFLTP